MNRYYTESVPADMARALKDKGMLTECHYQDGRPIIYDEPKSSPTWSSCKAWYVPTYGEVFDWFANKGVCICMTCTRRAFRMALGYGYVVQTIDKFYASESISHTWEKSAIRAIGQALELI